MSRVDCLNYGQTLDHLRRAHLVKLGTIAFSRHLEVQVSTLLTDIRDRVRLEFDSWLES